MIQQQMMQQQLGGNNVPTMAQAFGL